MLFANKRSVQVTAVIAFVLIALPAWTRPPAQDEEPNLVPVRTLVVASPRAAIVPLPTNDPEHPPMVGAACNFPSPPIRIVVRRGAVILFRESRNMEGVWYKRTFGTLETKLILQKLIEVDDGEHKWVTLGTDGARGTRRGPSIGRADVGVRHQFRELGTHLIRAVIITSAQPLHPTTDEALSSEGKVTARNTIPILVTVLPWVNPEDTDEEMVPLDPDIEATVPLDKTAE